MRSCIWKCSSDQLRPASPTESLGAELASSEGMSEILSHGRSKQADAVDVASEGPPSEEAWQISPIPAHEDVPTLPPPRINEPLPPIPEEGPELGEHLNLSLSCEK